MLVTKPPGWRRLRCPGVRVPGTKGTPVHLFTCPVRVESPRMSRVRGLLSAALAWAHGASPLWPEDLGSCPRVRPFQGSWEPAQETATLMGSQVGPGKPSRAVG